MIAPSKYIVLLVLILKFSKKMIHVDIISQGPLERGHL